MASPHRATRHEPAPQQQSETHRVVAFPAQAERELGKFVISPLQIMQMGLACLSEQQIADCLEHEGHVAGEVEGRHER